VLNVTPAPAEPDSGPTEEDIARANAAIDTYYRSHGGPRGPFGFPLKEVEFRWGIPSRRYSGGTITILGDGPRGGDHTYARVRYVGFRSYAESGEWSGSDEPYFIIGVAGSNNSNTVRFGPYEDVDAGDLRSEPAWVANGIHRIVPPIVIGIVAMENDEGTPAESEAKVRKVMEEIERKIEQAVGGLAGAATGSHVMPEWARDILLGWVPEGIAAILGLGDDEVGKKGMVLFDNKPELLAWSQPPVQGIHEGNEYTHKMLVGDGDEGQYELFFYVMLWKVTEGPSRR
jgi:hypothetical protein